MPETTGRILRQADVRVKGRFHLASNQGPATEPGGRNNVQVTPVVRLIENNHEFAVIELTCSCGQKTQVKCKYAGDNSAANTGEAAETPTPEKAIQNQT